MAGTIWGVNTLTALSDRYVAPYITDTYFESAPLTFRLKRRNKIVIKGGTWIEVPFAYKKPSSGGWYAGAQVLTTTPFDVVQNGSFPYAQLYNNVTVDGLTLQQSESVNKVCDYLIAQFELAKLDWTDDLATGMFSDGTNSLSVIGLNAAVDNGTLASTYGNLSRSTNPWLNAQIDSTTTTMTLAALNNLFGSCTVGGRAPTLIVSDRANYNRYINLNQQYAFFERNMSQIDQQFASAGYTNAVFNGIPWMEDDHVDTETNEGGVFFLNEEYIKFYVGQGGNFSVRDFIAPPNQDAMTALMVLYAQLVVDNPARQGKFTALAA